MGERQFYWSFTNGWISAVTTRVLLFSYLVNFFLVYFVPWNFNINLQFYWIDYLVPTYLEVIQLQVLAKLFSYQFTLINLLVKLKGIFNLSKRWQDVII